MGSRLGADRVILWSRSCRETTLVVTFYPFIIYQKTETTLTNIKKLLVAAPFKIEENKIDVLNAVIMFFALKVVLKPHLYHSQLTLGCLVNTSGLT